MKQLTDKQFNKMKNLTLRSTAILFLILLLPACFDPHHGVYKNTQNNDTITLNRKGTLLLQPNGSLLNFTVEGNRILASVETKSGTFGITGTINRNKIVFPSNHGRLSIFLGGEWVKEK
jgi:hypothetical protein